MPRKVSRRDMLKGAVVMSAASTVPMSALAQEGGSPAHAYVSLSAAAARTLEAIVARLIPSDANGPGALEAGAARYIDLALGDALADFRATYAAGLAAVDAHARRSQGKALHELAPEQQDGVLRDLEENRATRIHAERFDVFRPRARPHARGHVRRPALRRQPRFHRLGSGGLPGTEACRDGRGPALRRAFADHARVGLRLADVRRHGRRVA